MPQAQHMEALLMCNLNELDVCVLLLCALMVFTINLHHQPQCGHIHVNGASPASHHSGLNNITSVRTNQHIAT
jgi:hypothetical protein